MYQMAARLPLRSCLNQIRSVLFARPQYFFEAETATNQEMLHRRGRYRYILLLQQHCRKFRHRYVGLGCNPGKDEVTMRWQLSVPEPATRPGGITASLTECLYHSHSRRAASRRDLRSST